MSLQKYSGIFSAAWFMPCALVLGIILLLVHQQDLINRSLANSSKRLVVNGGETYIPRVSFRWLWVTLSAIAGGLIAGAIFSILWLRFYSQPVPSLAQSILVPRICKTVDCLPKVPKARVISSISNRTFGSGSPIVSGTGNIITYNNLGPESATPEQKRDVRLTLSDFMQKGEVLRTRCSSDCTNPKLEKEADAWFSEVLAFLREHLDSSFVVQFEHTTVTALVPGAVPQQCLGLYRGIDQRVETLNKFIDEFK